MADKERVWCVAIKYGRACLGEYKVSKRTERRVLLVDGGDATGYRVQLEPEEVYASEADARREMERLLEETIRWKKRELLALKEQQTANLARLNELGSDTKEGE